MKTEPDDVPPHLFERHVGGEQIFRGVLLDVRRDTVELQGGVRATREYIVHAGAVMVVPLLDDGRLVMERQYRYPVQRVLLEFPAGKIDPGEDTLTTARRELQEETGYRATEWARAGLLHNACAYSTEAIEVWFARGLQAGAARLDVGEHLEVCLLHPHELDVAVGRGEVTDAKTQVGLLWLQRWQAGAWALEWVTAP